MYKGFEVYGLIGLAIQFCIRFDCFIKHYYFRIMLLIIVQVTSDLFSFIYFQQ